MVFKKQRNGYTQRWIGTFGVNFLEKQIDKITLWQSQVGGHLTIWLHVGKQQGYRWRWCSNWGNWGWHILESNPIGIEVSHYYVGVEGMQKRSWLTVAMTEEVFHWKKPYTWRKNAFQTLNARILNSFHNSLMQMEGQSSIERFLTQPTLRDSHTKRRDSIEPIIKYNKLFCLMLTSTNWKRRLNSKHRLTNYGSRTKTWKPTKASDKWRRWPRKMRRKHVWLWRSWRKVLIPNWQWSNAPKLGGSSQSHQKPPT